MQIDEPRPPTSENVIIAPTDFSENALVGVRAAAALAGHFGASVVLVHVIDPVLLSPFAPFDRSGYPAITRSLHERAENGLAELRAELAGGIDIDTLVFEHSSVARGLAEYADEVGALMMVMCTHGRTGVQRLLLGSVTEKTVQLATCPVLSVPAPERGALLEAAVGDGDARVSSG